MKILIGLWIILLASIVAIPNLFPSPTYGEDLTRNTIRLTLLFYAVAVSFMICLSPLDWLTHSTKMELARWCWTLAWLAYLIHLAMAFHYYHRWSHAQAVEHTRLRSGFGEGIYFSHLFTLVWTADVLYWWVRPRNYAKRIIWFDRLLHGFMLFIIVNATIVFERGFIQWIGGAMVMGLLLLKLTWIFRQKPLHSPGNPEK